MQMKTATATAIKFTYKDYLLLPEDKRYEIIDGELFMAPAPSTYHQDISRDIEFILWNFVKENDLGKIYYAPCDVILSKSDIVQPDILFISKERIPKIVTEKNVRGAPDLIIEIISPSRISRDKVLKKKLYAKYGVKEYWIIDYRKEEIEVMVLGESGFKTVKKYRKDETLESPLIKGLRIDLREVF